MTDSAEAVRFLSSVRPSGWWVLVAIDPNVPNGQPDKIEARSFAAREAPDAESWIRSHNEAGRNIYWTVNPVMRPLAKKPARDDVAALEWLHVDVDPDKRLPLAEERARIDRLFGEGWPAGVPPASIVVDSGGGYQAFWRLREPMPIGGRAAAYDDAARYNQQLETLFGADACHNVDRIMRLPGTTNWPDARKRAAGRVPAPARVLRETSADYALVDFTPAPLRQVVGEPTFAVARASVQTSNVARLLSLDELPEQVSGTVKVVINVGHDPDNPRRWPSRSEPLFWVTCELVRAGVSDDVIYSVITDPDFGISESVIEKGARAEKYALQQIAHAHEHVDNPVLAEINRKHAVIADLGGKCRVIAESWDPTLEREHFSVQTFEDFSNRYSNRSVEVQTGETTKLVELGKWWLRHPMRRQYERMLFAPGRDVPGAYNLWRGFSCEAVPGDCSLYLEHVRTNICRGDARIYEYVLSWMARAVQRPGDVAHTAIVMRGDRGAGKSKFATTFGSLFGRHFFPVTNPIQLFGEFNEHLLDVVVAFADEAFFAGDKRHEAVLKGLVTESRRTTRALYRAAETTANCLHIIMATNSDWVVPAGSKERRFLVLDVGDGSLQNRAYFAALDEQMNSGGREALLHELLSRDISSFDPRDVPRTRALQEQKEHSLSLEEEWWYEKLRAGQFRDGEPWPSWVACSEVLHDFALHAQRWGRGQRTNATRLSRILEKVGARRKQLGRKVEVIAENGELRRVDRPRVYQLPDLDAARAEWGKLMGGDFDWTTPEVLQDTLAEEPYA